MKRLSITRWQRRTFMLALLTPLTLPVGAAPAGAATCTPRVSELPKPSSGFVTATAINDARLAVGLIADNTGRGRALIWRPGASRAIVLSLADAEANDVNNDGMVVGESEAGAFTWQAGRTQILPAPAGARSFGASAVNDRGAIVGATYDSSAGVFEKVIWQHGKIVRTLPPATGYTQNQMSAVDINNDGVVVGSAAKANGTSVAVVWPAAGGTPRILRSLTGGTAVEVHAVDAAGRVYGASYGQALGSWHATRWSATGDPQDLDANSANSGEHLVTVTSVTRDGRMALDKLGGGVRAAVLKPGEPARILPVSPKEPQGFYYSGGINSLGDVVGHYDVAAGYGKGQAVVWRCTFG